jgi:hypothetical protein
MSVPTFWRNMMPPCQAWPNLLEVDTAEIRRRKFISFIRWLKGFSHILRFAGLLNKKHRKTNKSANLSSRDLVSVCGHAQTLAQCQNNLATCFLSVLASHSWWRQSSIGNWCRLKMVDDGMYRRTEKWFIHGHPLRGGKKSCVEPNQYSLTSVRCRYYEHCPCW